MAGNTPKIALGSIQQPMPSGYFLGRSSQGTGPVELLSISQIASNPKLKAAIAAGVPTPVITLTMPSIFVVSGSPGQDITVTLATETANYVWAGPATGPAATPTFRALVAGDLPSGTTPTGANPTATAGPVAVNGSAPTFMRSDGAPAVQKASASQFGIVEVDNTTITASGGVISAVAPSVPTGANPSATASDTAVNGSASTFMRSDAAPAVQTATSGQFGLVKVDGTTITASGGVISSTGGATGANPTATAGPVAVNGSASTFMRSDAAPAVQTATNSQLGLVQPDGSTITISAGVISAAGSVSGANPTATAGPAAVNGSASTFMRSDAAPAVQKATAAQFGIVEVDGTTITASSGVISATGAGAVTTVVNASGLQFFGDGSDGNVTVTTSISLTRDMYYNNLTISGGGSINTKSFRVFVYGTLDLSAAGANAITNSGAGFAAGSPSRSTFGSITSNSVGGSYSNGTLTGGVGSTTTSTAGGTSTSEGQNTGGVGGTGGTGGTSGATIHAGAVGGAVSAITQIYDVRNLTITLVAFYISTTQTIVGGTTGSGGGSGGGDGTGTGGNGGSGGQGGGVCFVSAAVLKRNTGGTAAACITAQGGRGSDGAAGAGGTNPAGGAGGGGGGGGWLYLIVGTLSGTAVTNMIDASGGTGGKGGNALGSGAGGQAGGGGGGGRISYYLLSSQTLTAVTPVAATSGSAASGTTGGAATAATTQAVTV